MSLSMVLGRVLLPAAGLILAVAITWHAVRSITAVRPTPVRSGCNPSRRGSGSPRGSPPRGGSSPIPVPR